MTILLLGAGGQIGRAVLAAAAAADAPERIVALTRAELDLRDREAICRKILELRPSWIVNAAAYTAVDKAEDEPREAALINDAAVQSLAEAAREAGARVLHLSTDFVFDGTSSKAYPPQGLTAPLNLYGISKLAGELQALESPDNIVLRTSWVYASRGQNFVLKILSLMRERERLEVVCDQIGTPTWAASVAQAIARILALAPRGGVYHWTDTGVASWYDFAVAIQEEAMQRHMLSGSIPIRAIRSDQFPARARRPAFSVLDCDSTRAALGMTAPHWRVNLRSMLDELRAL